MANALYPRHHQMLQPKAMQSSRSGKEGTLPVQISIDLPFPGLQLLLLVISFRYQTYPQSI